MKRAWAFVLLGMMNFMASRAFALEDFPPAPDERLTPGSLCTDADEYRYPERIPTCERSVNVETKLGVFSSYMGLGYRINMQHRSSYKIDHLIPLCAGGSNDVDNLWPEYIDLFESLDPIEPAICEKMSSGRLKQKQAIELVIRAKQFPEEAPKLIEYVQSL